MSPPSPESLEFVERESVRILGTRYFVVIPEGVEIVGGDTKKSRN